MPGIAQPCINGFGEIAVLIRMRAVVVIEGDAEIREILQMFPVHALD